MWGGVNTRQLFKEIAPDYSATNDPFGHLMGAFFAVVEELHFNRGVEIPAAWKFRPGIGGVDSDSYEHQVIAELKPSDLELLRLGRFCHRLYGIVDRAGKSY